MTGSLDDAYRLCESITKEQARNFYYGIRLLPAAKRSVLCAVYALARRVDDIGDGDLPTAREGDRAGRRPLLAGTPRCHDRSGTGRGGRRRPPVPDPAGRLRRTGRRGRDGRDRAAVRHVRRSRRVLPVRGGVDRPTVPGRVRQPTGPGRAGVRRRAGHRAAADEHPARHPRGPDQRTGVPAAGGSRPVRRRTRPRRAGSVDGQGRRAGGAHPVQRAARPPLVRRRAASGTAAGPAQRGERGGDVGHLPAAAGAHRPPSRSWCTTGGWPCPAGRRPASRPAR